MDPIMWHPGWPSPTSNEAYYRAPLDEKARQTLLNMHRIRVWGTQIIGGPRDRAVT
jgi:hypothetical protein